MGTFLLTWNPEYRSPDDVEWAAIVEAIENGSAVDGERSTGGRSSGIDTGDIVYLVRQGSDGRGVVARGHATGPVRPGPPWRAGTTAPVNFVPVQWTSAVSAGDALPIEVLSHEVPGVAWRYLQGSGVAVEGEAATQLNVAWERHTRDQQRQLPPRRALCIYVPKSRLSQANLEKGLDGHTWGFTKPRDIYVGHPADWVIIADRHDNGGPRVQEQTWRAGSLHVYLCKMVGDFYLATAPFWNDETAAGAVRYPHRFGLEPLFELESVPASADGPLGVDVSDNLRQSGTQHGWGYLADFDPAPLFRMAGLGTPAATPFSATPGVSPATPKTRAAARSEAQRNGRAGRERDALVRAAVERRSLDVAKQFLRGQGWTDLTELGKPYDLDCRRRGAELHVEVKGSQGAGATVELTRNEVDHARTCSVPTMLIVVSDIAVERTDNTATGHGGTLASWDNWSPADESLRASKYDYDVPR